MPELRRSWVQLRKGLGSVARMSISSSPGSNLTPGFFISLLKYLLGIILIFIFRACNNQIWTKRIRLDFLSKLSGLKPDFMLTLCNFFQL